jgi:protoporphyrinogen oxidase
MTGLAAGLASGYPVLERSDGPGGLCASYACGGYRFERGGGHWIFGGDPVVNRLLGASSDLKSYRRRSAVLFLGGLPCTRELRGRMVPYPIQENLFALPAALRAAALVEMRSGDQGAGGATMAEWLLRHFGPTLCGIFFEPFHERYTAGCFREIAPQDSYKSPIDLSRVERGAREELADTGYNATFLYPARGLDEVSRWLAGRCAIEYDAEVAHIDTRARSFELADGTGGRYERLIATSPLNRTVELAGLSDGLGPADPHTSVLVINLGVMLPQSRFARHGYHWLYVPDSRTGFHRIGYYSNVDPLFLPEDRRDRGSLYVEMAFRGGNRPSEADTVALVAATVAELAEAELIAAVDVADASWVDVAYTWRLPGSDWVDRAIGACREQDIEPAGRFGRWCFQGIAASLREGLLLGAVLPRVA